MRKFWMVAVVAVAAAVMSTPLRAQVDQLSEKTFRIQTAADLLRLCDPVPGHQFARDAIHMCHGIVIGAYGVHEAAVPRLGRIVCPPEGTTRNDGVRTFVNWMKAHPASLSEPAIDALFRSWVANYPCPGN